MCWRYLFLVLALFSVVSCNRGPAARAPWAAIDANQAFLGGLPPDSSHGAPINVLTAITSVECGASQDAAYLINVMWITDMPSVGFVRIEYEVNKTSDDVLVMDNPLIAKDIFESITAGTATISLANTEIDEAGDLIMVRIVVGGAGGVAEISSPIDVYRIASLCSGAEIYQATEEIEVPGQE